MFDDSRPNAIILDEIDGAMGDKQGKVSWCDVCDVCVLCLQPCDGRFRRACVVM